MKIHHSFIDEFHGRDTLETLCNRIVTRVRDPEGKTLRFKTDACDNFPLTSDPRDVTCSTCQHVWRTLR